MVNIYNCWNDFCKSNYYIFYGYIVVGAGLSGAVIARRLAEKKRSRVLVIDKREHIGGNCYDYKDKKTNINVHKYGPHVFHTNKENVWNFLSKFTEWEPFFYRVKAYIDGNEVNIPYNLDSLYQCFSHQLANKLEKKLLDKYKFGTRLCLGDLLKQEDEDLLFLAEYVKTKIFDGYSIKQWGISIQDLDLSVANRVPILVSKDNRYFQDKYSAIPKYGYTNMINSILDHEYIDICLNTKYSDISYEIHNNSIFRNSSIYYSGSIDELFDYRFGVLPYRSLDIKFNTYDREFYQSCAQINYPNDMDYTRSVEYKYYLNDVSKYTVVSKEYPCEYNIERALIDRNHERFYPIENSENEALYANYIEFAQKNNENIRFIGRLGLYKYLNMDEIVTHCLDMTLL